MNTSPPIIHIVDDDLNFSTSISRLLKAFNYEVVVHASADEFLTSPPNRDRGCLLLDVRMPGLSGLDVQNQLLKLKRNLPIVFLTGYRDIEVSVMAIKAGAEDFLVKPIAKDRLFGAIQRALARYDEIHKRSCRLESLQERVASLTIRQKEVFSLMVRGKLNKQIAFSLGTSERTIKAHRQSVMQKLQVKSLAEAVSIAERAGFVSPTHVEESWEL